MTWLRVALSLAAIFFLVAMPIVGWQGVRSVRCAYQIPGGYGHAAEYNACISRSPLNP